MPLSECYSLYDYTSISILPVRRKSLNRCRNQVTTPPPLFLILFHDNARNIPRTWIPYPETERIQLAIHTPNLFRLKLRYNDGKFNVQGLFIRSERPDCVAVLPVLRVSQSSTPLHPAGQRSVIWAVLDVGTIRFQLVVFFHLFIQGSFELGESPFLRHVDLLNKKT